MKVTKCEGEVQGSCKRCSDNGKWNRIWTSMLYKIEGLEGCYCSDCVKEITKEKQIGVEDSDGKRTYRGFWSGFGDQ